MKSYVIQEHDTKILKLKVDGHSYSEIARKLNITPRTVQRRLKRLPKTYPGLRKLISDIEEDKRIVAFLKGEQPKVGVLERKFKEGYHLGNAPYGYIKDEDGELIQVPEEAKVVKQIFELRDQRKSADEIAQVTGFPDWKVLDMLHNPVYEGWVRFRGRKRPGRHKRIIDPDLWNRVQSKIKHPFGIRKLPFGYVYENEQIVIDREKEPLIKKMFRLRIEGKSFTEIETQLGMAPGSVRARFNNPFYAARKSKDGRWVKMDHEPIISFDTWLAASRIDLRAESRKAMGRAMRKTRLRNENRILKFMGDRELTVSEIAEGIGLSKSAVHVILHVLKERMEYIPPKEKRKGAVPFPGKWRIKI